MQGEDFAHLSKEGLVLKVYVQPGAARSELAGVRREELGGKSSARLKIRLKARAVEGAANQALTEFLADLCRRPKSSISLTSGQTARSKTVLISGAGEETLHLLQQAVAGSL